MRRGGAGFFLYGICCTKVKGGQYAAYCMVCEVGLVEDVPWNFPWLWCRNIYIYIFIYIYIYVEDVKVVISLYVD